MTQMLKASLKEYIEREHHLIAEGRAQFAMLQNRESQYAREIRCLIDIHEKMLAVLQEAWDSAAKAGLIEGG